MKEEDTVRIAGTEYIGKILAIDTDGDGQPLYSVGMPKEAIEEGSDPIEQFSEQLIEPEE